MVAVITETNKIPPTSCIKGALSTSRNINRNQANLIYSLTKKSKNEDCFYYSSSSFNLI